MAHPRTRLRLPCAAIEAACVLVVATPALAQLRAFPEAEGFGASAVGGRGGTVYHVTNLNDSGAGSFRDAVSQPNRIVVFDVGGYIPLSTSLTVKDHITIAGQTAPGQGIATRGASVSFKNSNNTIVRNMRFRLGVGSGGDAAWADTTTTDVIFDHVTAQWGQDESFSVTGCDRITIQNCIIAEGLLPHSMGSLIEWNTISMHHNLYISNNSRNPKTKGVNDFVNNVIYNWGTEPFIAGDSAGVSEANVVNNYFLRGPSSGADPDPFSRGNANYHLYQAGNYYDSNKNGLVDGTLLTPALIDDPMTYMPSPYAYPAIRTDTALRAYEKVVAGAGASYVRDPVDTRLIDDLVNQTGSVITDPLTNTALGFGTIAGGVAPTDTDQDGMPNAWEAARGLNPNSAADRNNIGPSGYTRVEEYLNDLMTAKNGQRIWTAGSGVWSAGASWGGSQPTTDDDAFVKAANASVNGVVNVTTGTASAFRLYIGQNGLPAGERVNVSGTGRLDVPYLITVGYQNAATLSVTGGEVDTWAISLGNTLNGTFDGTLNFSGGIIRAGRIDTGGTGAFNWSGGTLKARGSELTITPNIAMSASAGTFDTESGATISASGLLSGAAGVTKAGTGNLTLSNSLNTFTGPTTINGGGTLTVSSIANGGSPSSIGAGSTSASDLVLNGGVKIQFAGGGSSNRGMTVDSAGLVLATNTGVIFTLSGPIVFSGLGDRSLTVDLAGTSSNISELLGAIGDPVSGGKTTLIKNGAARLSLSATSKTYSGDTKINAGSVLAFSTNVLPYGTGKGNVIINAGANLDVRSNININGLSGAGSLINGSGGARTVTLGNGNAAGDFSGPITNGTSIVKVGAGTQVLSGIQSYTGSTTVSGGTLKTVRALQNGTALSISANAVLDIPVNGAATGVSVFKSISIPASGAGYAGRIDLHDNDLVVEYGSTASPYSNLLAMVKSGLPAYGGNGTGIVSTEVSNNSLPGATLAVVDNAAVGGVLAQTSGYIGITAQSVVIKYTWLGDANLDGVVDGTDYALTDSGFAGGGNRWNTGDYNYSGGVDGTDYALIDTGYGSQSGTLPEPATLGLLAFGAMAMLRRRCR